MPRPALRWPRACKGRQFSQYINGLKGFSDKKKEMARLDGATSNELFEVLADWNTHLEHLKADKPRVPSCP